MRISYVHTVYFEHVQSPLLLLTPPKFIPVQYYSSIESSLTECFCLLGKSVEPTSWCGMSLSPPFRVNAVGPVNHLSGLGTNPQKGGSNLSHVKEGGGIT